MADEREPPPLFEDDPNDNDNRELDDDNDDDQDIFQSEKKVQISNRSHETSQDEKIDYTKFEDVTEDVLNGNPVGENEFESTVPEIPAPSLKSDVPVKNDNETITIRNARSESPPQPKPSWPQAEKEVAKEPKPLFGSSKDDPPKVSVTESSTTYATVSKPAPPPFGFHSLSRKEQASNEPEEDSGHSIDVTITETKKVGDGMNAYVVYKVCTKTSIPDFRRTEMEVFRRFSDFLGLRDKLAEKHLQLGIIIPPPPEKSIIGMAKIKVSKDESGSMEFVEQRRAALERFLNRVAQHALLRSDPSFVDFLELEGDLPKATNTSALSGAGVLRLFSRVGDSIGKIAYKMDETDQWFEEKTQQVETLDFQLKKLHSSLETLVTSRKDLAQSTGILAKSVALLGACEENSAISHALNQLADTEEHLDRVYETQADDDFYIFAEFVKDYVGLLQSVKDVFHERIKLYKIWKDNEVMLAKKREAKVRMELAHKLDKIQDASREISEWELNVDKSQQDFEKISKNIHKEMKRFEAQRCKDFRRIVIAYLESLLNHEQQVIRHWESFLPDARQIV